MKYIKNVSESEIKTQSGNRDICIAAGETVELSCEEARELQKRYGFLEEVKRMVPRALPENNILNKLPQIQEKFEEVKAELEEDGDNHKEIERMEKAKKKEVKKVVEKKEEVEEKEQPKKRRGRPSKKLK